MDLSDITPLREARARYFRENALGEDGGRRHTSLYRLHIDERSLLEGETVGGLRRRLGMAD
ncbi:MAG TPA: hypothetical protein VF310_05230 [Vicinamibacteria bacterium]